MNTGFVFFVFFPLTIFAHFHLSICAIFRDEAPYFKEWIEFHKLQGVEHFYLYNNNSEDDYLKTLQPYVNTGAVTLVEWPFEYNPGAVLEWQSIQLAAYMDCISTYGLTTDWLAVIDIDEFLFSPSGKTLPQILENYQEYGGVCANWRLFGTSNVKSIPPGKSMIELLTHCSLASDPINLIVKSIIRPERVLFCRSPHCFYYKEGFYAVDTDRNKMCGRLSTQAHYDQLQINHYWTRTKKDFLNQKIKSRLGRRSNITSANLRERAKAYNLDVNFFILQFVPALNAKL